MVRVMDEKNNFEFVVATTSIATSSDSYFDN